ncbi:hypothetical protein ACEOWJ_004881 [Bacillus cereus]|uniref:hypothetical protein n=1 Tax=Bacillus TaxID=1386 RepID=UPI0005599BBF|nr:hypothetical protein [Bacillus sp. UNC322MFChir4.1]
MIIYLLLFLIWLFFLLVLLIQVRKLAKALALLPKPKFIEKKLDSLIKKDISNILELPNSYSKHDESIIMLMAASCKICHEKLDEIIHKNKHKSHNLIIYLYSETPDLYNQFNNNIQAHYQLPVFPLSDIQKNQLQTFVFPTFIRINSKATITKISPISDKAL